MGCTAALDNVDKRNTRTRKAAWENGYAAEWWNDSESDQVVVVQCGNAMREDGLGTVLQYCTEPDRLGGRFEN